MTPKRYKISIIFLIVTLLILQSTTSCSPIKRHQRLVAKFPYVHQTDTVKIIDTFRFEVAKVEIDTVFLTSLLRDTITIEKDRLKIRMYTVHDSIFVSAECDTITIEKIVERNIPVKFFEQKTPFQNYLNWILIGLFILAMLYVISKFIKKRN